MLKRRSVDWIEKNITNPDFDILIEVEKLTEEFLCKVIYEMKKKKMRIDDLARKMNCSRSTIKRILKKDTDLKLNQMVKLCSILGIRFGLRIG